MEREGGIFVSMVRPYFGTLLDAFPVIKNIVNYVPVYLSFVNTCVNFAQQFISTTRITGNCRAFILAPVGGLKKAEIAKIVKNHEK